MRSSDRHLEPVCSLGQGETGRLEVEGGEGRVLPALHRSDDFGAAGIGRPTDPEYRIGPPCGAVREEK
jgi:hypothetical protein